MVCFQSTKVSWLHEEAAMVEMTAVAVVADLARQHACSAQPDAPVVAYRERSRHRIVLRVEGRRRTARLLHRWADRLWPSAA